jgi:hypothetical protein
MDRRGRDRPNSVVNRYRHHAQDPKTAGTFEFLKGELTMSLRNVIIAALCASTLVSSPAFGQENLIFRTDIRIEASVPVVKSLNAGVARQSSYVNGGFLCTYRLFSNNLNNTQTYSPYKGSIGLKNKSDQVCAKYVFRFSVKRWSPITPATALMLDYRTVTGGAPDFYLEHRSFPRTEHRGSFYNSATLNTGGLNDLYRFSNSEVPAAVFGYNF